MLAYLIHPSTDDLNPLQQNVLFGFRSFIIRYFSLWHGRELLIMLLFSHKQNYSTKRKSSWLTKAGSDSVSCQFCDGICSTFPLSLTSLLICLLHLQGTLYTVIKSCFYNLASCDWQLLSLSPPFALSATCSLVKLSQTWTPTVASLNTPYITVPINFCRGETCPHFNV